VGRAPLSDVTRESRAPSYVRMAYLHSRACSRLRMSINGTAGREVSCGSKVNRWFQVVADARSNVRGCKGGCEVIEEEMFDSTWPL
jgi:hypothetical protein